MNHSFFRILLDGENRLSITHKCACEGYARDCGPARFLSPLAGWRFLLPYPGFRRSARKPRARMPVFVGN